MKVAVITGAANGIGLALSQIHLQKGHTVVMVDKDKTKLQEEADRLKEDYPSHVLEYSCDITHSEQVKDLAQQIEKELGRVDWIYNNAGIIGSLAPVWDLDPEYIHQVMNVNLHGMIQVIQAFIPFLFQQNFRSHIINMASLYALCSGSQMAPYSMSKHAVLALSESLHFDLVRLDKPVDISIVFPSFTDTGLLSAPSTINANFHNALKALLAHSRPAMDIAAHIIQEVEQKQFYIFPDREVKGYYEERTEAMLLQEKPHQNNIEKLMNSLIKRRNL